MTDMFGRPVEVGDIVVFHAGRTLQLVRVTKFNPATQRISVKPVDKRGLDHGYGWSGEFRPAKIMLVRELDLVVD